MSDAAKVLMQYIINYREGEYMLGMGQTYWRNAARDWAIYIIGEGC